MRRIPDSNRQRAYLELLSKLPPVKPPRLTAPVNADHRRKFTHRHDGLDARHYYQAVYLQQHQLDRR